MERMAEDVEIDAAYLRWQNGRHKRSTAKVAADLSEGALAAISERFELAFKAMASVEEQLEGRRVALAEREEQNKERTATLEQRKSLIAERERWVQEREEALRWREEHVWGKAERGPSGVSREEAIIELGRRARAALTMPDGGL